MTANGSCHSAIYHLILNLINAHKPINICKHGTISVFVNTYPYFRALKPTFRNL
jgi:hypothetical protein